MNINKCFEDSFNQIINHTERRGPGRPIGTKRKPETTIISLRVNKERSEEIKKKIKQYIKDI